MAKRGGKKASKTTAPSERTAPTREVFHVGFIVFSVFTAVALWGWSPEDPTWSSPRLDEVGVSNPCGPLGANWSDVLLSGFGYGAFVMPGMALMSLLSLAGREVLGWKRSLVVVVTFVCAMAMLTLGLETGPGEVYGAGGGLGSVVSGALLGVIGAFGAWLLLVVGFASGLVFLAGQTWGHAAAAVVDVAERAMPVVEAKGAGAAKAAMASIEQTARAGGAAAGQGLSASAKGGGAMVRLAGRGMKSAGQRFVDFWSEVWWSLVPSEEERTLTDTVWDEHTVPPSEADELPESFIDPSDLGAEGPELTKLQLSDPGEHVPTDATQWSVQPEFPEAEEGPQTAGTTDVLGLFPELGGRRAAPVSVSEPAVERTPEPSVVSRVSARPEKVVPRTETPVESSVPSTIQPEPPSEVVIPVPQQASAESAPVNVPRRQTPVVAELGVEGPAPKVEPAEGLLDVAPGKDDGRALVKTSRRETFHLPPLRLLDEVPTQRASIDQEDLLALATTVEESLASFRVTGRVTNVRVGPVVTTFEFLPDAGISVRKINNLADDLAMALCALSVRVVAPIPGKGVVGIEIPSADRLTIYFRELLAAEEFRKSKGALPVVLGKDVEGRPMMADLAKMPHLLVGGTTGSGKSVGVNGMLMSLLFTRKPEDLRLLLIDPKKLEFEAYSDVPHLLHPVVTDPKGAAAALAWACREMDRRYELLARWKTRNISNYNEKVERESRDWSRLKAVKYAPKAYEVTDGDPPGPEKLPYIVIVIDELADLMMVAKKEVQDSIVRLAQMARACGMHLIIATQRPSVDVVTGLIKSNMPTRIAFKLRSVIDSRTILDQGGAEKLLGMGDMLYLPGAGEVRRCHGAFVSDDEVVRVIEHLKDQAEPDYFAEVTTSDGAGEGSMGGDAEEQDELYDRAVQIVIDSGKASTSMIQRHLKIGYNRAARIIDAMEHAGVIGPADGARPREVLVGQS